MHNNKEQQCPTMKSWGEITTHSNEKQQHQTMWN
jgi:hypothetical protein